MPSKSAVRYRHDDDGISLEGKGRKHKAHASWHKSKGGSSHSHSRSGSKKSSHKHGSHKSKHYYSDSDSSSASSESTFLDPSDSEWGYSSDDTAVTSRSAKSKSTGIMTILRGKRDDDDDASSTYSRRHKPKKSSTAHRPSKYRPGTRGIRDRLTVREGAGMLAFMYGAFQHLKDRYNGEHTSKLHHAMMHAGVWHGVKGHDRRMIKGVKKGLREPYEKKPHRRSRRSHKDD